MFKKFQIHLLDNFPHLKNQKILLALSGGLDSCVLLSLCLKQGLNISIAHCNFQLRGKDSEEDALWIKKLADKNKLECKLKRFNTEVYAKNKKISIQSILVEHGKVKSNCFIVNKKLAYISDVSNIYNKDHKFFKNLQYLIIDCLWYNYHPSHFNLETSLAVIKKFKPKKAILTNLSPVLDYKVLKKTLPKNVIPAYDGLTVNL